MKKILTRSSALVVCALMCLSLAACGKANLESFFKKNQDYVDQMVASQIQDENCEVEVTAKENTMIYNFTFKIDEVEYFSALGFESREEVVEYLTNYLDSAEEGFDSILESLKTQVSTAEAIQVNYIDKDGETLATKEYK